MTLTEVLIIQILHCISLTVKPKGYDTQPLMPQPVFFPCQAWTFIWLEIVCLWLCHGSDFKTRGQRTDNRCCLLLLFIYLALLFIAFEAILNLGFMLSILLNIKVCNVAILEISSTLF